MAYYSVKFLCFPFSIGYMFQGDWISMYLKKNLKTCHMHPICLTFCCFHSAPFQLGCSAVGWAPGRGDTSEGDLADLVITVSQENTSPRSSGYRSSQVGSTTGGRDDGRTGCKVKFLMLASCTSCTAPFCEVLNGLATASAPVLSHQDPGQNWVPLVQPAEFPRNPQVGTEIASRGSPGLACLAIMPKKLNLVRGKGETGSQTPSFGPHISWQNIWAISNIQLLTFTNNPNTSK